MKALFWISYKNFIFKWERTVLAIIAVAFSLAPILTILIIDANAIHSRISYFITRNGYFDLEIYAREFTAPSDIEDYEKKLSTMDGVRKATFILTDSIHSQDYQEISLLASPAWNDSAYRMIDLKSARNYSIKENEIIVSSKFAERHDQGVGTNLSIKGFPLTIKYVFNSDKMISINGKPTVIVHPLTFVKLFFESDTLTSTQKPDERKPTDYIPPIFNNDPDMIAVIDAIKKNAPRRLLNVREKKKVLRPIFWVKLQDIKQLNRMYKRLSTLGIVKIPEYHFINNRTENRIMRNTLKMTGIFAFVLGLFIIYNSFAYSTIERQKEMALLNSIGLSKKDMIHLLLFEGLFIAITGTILSLFISFPTSFFLMMKNISTLGSQRYSITMIPGPDIILVMLVGIFCVLASIVYSAILVFNIDSARLLNPKGFVPYKIKLLRHPFWFVFSLLFIFSQLFIAFVFILDIVDMQFLSGIYKGSGLIVVFALCIMCFPKIIEKATRLAAYFFRKIFRNDGMLAHLLWGAEFRTHLLAIIGITTIFSIIYTTKITTQAIVNELYQWAKQPTENKLFVERKNISLHTINSLKRNIIEDFVYLPIYPYVHVPYSLKGMDLDLLTPYTNDRKAKKALERYKKGKGVIITRALAAEIDKEEGDTILLNSLYGTVPFEILLISDKFGYFNDDRNYILMPVKMVIDLFSPMSPPADKMTIFKFQPDVDAFTAFAHEDKEKILNTLYEETYRVKIMDGNWLYVRKIAKRQLDFSIFNYIWFFCIIVGGIGIFNSIIIKAIENRNELALFNVLGLHKRQFFKIMLIHSMLIGLAGGLFAVIVAQPLTYIAIYSFKQFTGFDVQYFVDGKLIIFFLVLSLVTSVIAALYPTYKISKENLSQVIRYE